MTAATDTLRSPNDVAGCGMATAAMTFELFTLRRFLYA
jgi:hypothetical protein